MVKKNKTEAVGGMIAIFLLIAALCLMIGIALLPLILLIASLYYHNKFKRIKDSIRNHLSDFWLSDEEQKEFMSKSMIRMEHAEKIAAEERRCEEAGISKNKDGQYSIRSNLGKRMREVYHDSGLLIEQIDERLQGLRTKPLTQWEEFNSAASTSKACYVGLIVWLSIVAYYLSSAYKGGLLEPTLGGIFSYLGAAYVEIFLRVTSFGERHTPHIVESLQIIGYSFGGAILSFLIVKGIFRNYGSRFSPKPPKVTLSNLSLPIVPNQSNAAHPPMAASPVLEANNDQLVGKNVNDIPSPAVAIPSVSLPASPALGADSPRPKAKLPFHLNVVAGFNTIVGILSLLWAGLSLLILFSPHSEKIVFAFVFLLSAACGIMQLMAGIRLRKEKSGSRKLGIIASIVSCCSIWEYFVFPFCLICGIYTLIVLSKSDIRHFLEDPNKPRIN